MEDHFDTERQLTRLANDVVERQTVVGKLLDADELSDTDCSPGVPPRVPVDGRRRETCRRGIVGHTVRGRLGARGQWRRHPGRRAAELALDNVSQVLDEVKAVGHLTRLRCALRRCDGIQAAAIAADHLDLRTRPEPSSCGVRPTIGQQVHHLAALQVHDQRAVCAALAPTPVVDPDDPERPWSRPLRALERAQDGVTAGRQTQPRGQPVCRPAADGMTRHPATSDTRRVRRAAKPAASGVRLQNVCRRQSAFRHRQRWTETLITTGRPWAGRS